MMEKLWKNHSIIRVEDPVNLWIKDTSENSDSCKEFREFEVKFNDYFHKQHHMQSGRCSKLPPVGSNAAVLRGTNWYRAIVDYPMSPCKTQVFLIDYAICMMADISEIIPYSDGDGWSSVIYQARRIQILGIKPLTLDYNTNEIQVPLKLVPSSKWNDSATKFVKKLMKSDHVCDFEYITLLNDGTYAGNLKIQVPKSVSDSIMEQYNSSTIFSHPSQKVSLADILDEFKFGMLVPFPLPQQRSGLPPQRSPQRYDSQLMEKYLNESSKSLPTPEYLENVDQKAVSSNAARSPHYQDLSPVSSYCTANERAPSIRSIGSSKRNYDSECYSPKRKNYFEDKRSFGRGSSYKFDTTSPEGNGDLRVTPLKPSAGRSPSFGRGKNVGRANNMQPPGRFKLEPQQTSQRRGSIESTSSFGGSPKLNQSASLPRESSENFYSHSNGRTSLEHTSARNDDNAMSEKSVPRVSRKYISSQSISLRFPSKNKNLPYEDEPEIDNSCNSLDINSSEMLPTQNTQNSNQKDLQRNAINYPFIEFDSIYSSSSSRPHLPLDSEGVAPSAYAGLARPGHGEQNAEQTVELGSPFGEQGNLQSTLLPPRRGKASSPRAGWTLGDNSIYSSGPLAIQSKEIITERTMKNVLNPLVYDKYQQNFPRDEPICPLYNYMWPTILKNRSCFAIERHNENSKSYGHIVPSISSLVDTQMLLEKRLPKLTGPIMIIVCYGWVKAHKVYSWVEGLLPDNGKLKATKAYSGMHQLQIENCKIDLSCGHHILVATLPLLSRFISENQESNFKFLNPGRLSTLVFEDTELLIQKFPHEFTQVIKFWSDAGDTHKIVPKQLVSVGSEWNKGIDNLFKQVSCTMRPNVVIASHFESARACKIKTLITFFPSNEFKEYALEIIRKKQSKLIILVESQAEAKEMFEHLQTIAITPLMITEKLEFLIKIELEKWRCIEAPTMIVCLSSLEQLYFSNFHNAATLVFISIPKSRNDLGKCYSLLLDHFGTVEGKDSKASAHVMLRKSQAKEYPDMIKVLSLLGEVPKDALKFQEEISHSLNEENKSVSLCTRLKALGSCPFAYCHWRHRIDNSDCPIHIPQSGNIEFDVLSMDTASRFIIRLNKWTPPDSHKPEDFCIYYKTLSNRLEEYFSTQNKKRMTSSNKLKDMLCATMYRNKWSRAKVMNVGFSENMHDYDLFLIDDGKHITRRGLESLYELPKKFQEMPHLALEAFLSNVAPQDDDLDWTENAKHITKEYIFNHSETTFEATISLALDKTLWLENFVSCRKIHDTYIQNHSLEFHLTSHKVAMWQPSHLSNLQDLSKDVVDRSQTSSKLIASFTSAIPPCGSFQYESSSASSDSTPVASSASKTPQCADSAMQNGRNSIIATTSEDKYCSLDSSNIYNSPTQNSGHAALSEGRMQNRSSDMTTPTTEKRHTPSSSHHSPVASSVSKIPPLYSNHTTSPIYNNIEELLSTPTRSQASNLFNGQSCMIIPTCDDRYPSSSNSTYSASRRSKCSSSVSSMSQSSRSERSQTYNRNSLLPCVKDERNALVLLNQLGSTEQLDMDTDTNVEICEIVSPNEFYVTKTVNEKKLDILHQSLKDIAPKQRSTCPFNKGSIVLAIVENSIYHTARRNRRIQRKSNCPIRARVLEVVKNECKIFSLDFGDVTFVPLHKIFPYPFEEVRELNLPPQAILCQMAHTFVPPNKQKDASSAMDEIESQRVSWFVKPIAKKVTTKSVMYVVEVQDPVTDPPINMFDELLKKGVIMDERLVANKFEERQIQIETETCSVQSESGRSISIPSPLPTLPMPSPLIAPKVCWVQDMKEILMTIFLRIPNDYFISFDDGKFKFHTTIGKEDYCIDEELLYPIENWSEREVNDTVKITLQKKVQPPFSGMWQRLIKKRGTFEWLRYGSSNDSFFSPDNDNFRATSPTDSETNSGSISRFSMRSSRSSHLCNGGPPSLFETDSDCDSSSVGSNDLFGHFN